MGLFEGGGRRGGGGVGDSFPLECIPTSKTGWHTLNTVEPPYNKPLYNKVLGITNDFLYSRPSNSKTYGKVPRYLKTSLLQTNFVSPLALHYIVVPLYYTLLRFPYLHWSQFQCRLWKEAPSYSWSYIKFSLYFADKKIRNFLVNLCFKHPFISWILSFLIAGLLSGIIPPRVLSSYSNPTYPSEISLLNLIFVWT